MELDIIGLLGACSYALDCVEAELTHVATKHGKRVAYMSVCTAQKMGITGDALQDLAACSLLHDNALTQYIHEEFHNDLTKNNTENITSKQLGIHCIYGEENLKMYPFLTDVKNVILYHHENADGSGQAERVVYVIDLEDKKDSTAVELVKNLFATKMRDYVTEVDEQSIVLIKDVRDVKNEDELQKLADMIVDNMHTEAMVRVRVGYGNQVNNLPDIAKSYQEAKMALEVGKIFYAEKETIAYRYLGIGRLIYQLPMSLCEMFIHEVFGDEIPDIFNEETTTTIQKFFENNLNISETARQLYVHRNTLVYRLERLEKIIGLDIRKFDDAMTFKLALMVISHMRYARRQDTDQR